MAEAKKASAKSTKNVPKADLIEMAAAPAAETESVVEATSTLESAVSPVAKAADAGALLSSVQAQGDALRQAVSAAVAESAKGALEVNDKIIEALNAQHHAALDLWRSAITTSDLPQAFQTQTKATRQAYEAASAQWKDIAETTARWVTKSFEPLQSALHRHVR